MINWKNDIINNDLDSFEIGNIWSYADNLSEIINDMIYMTANLKYDCIAGIETKGLIFASGLSAKTGIPLIVFRKKDKIAYTEKKISDDFINWKGQKDGIEIELDLLFRYQNILIVDDLSYSLATFKSVSKIINQKEKIVSFLCVANLSAEDEIDGKPILSIFKKKAKN